MPLGATELRLDDLEYDTDYRFKVHAYTRAGQGPPNSADAKTLPEALRLNGNILCIYFLLGILICALNFGPSAYAKLLESAIGVALLGRNVVSH